MIEFENQIEIDRPVDEAFAFIADFENIPKWNYYVIEVNKTSQGPIEEGATFYQRRKTDEQTFRIAAYQPNRIITVRTIPPSSPAFEITFTFEAVGGGTRITDTWKLDTGRPALLERLASRKVKSAVLENLGKLKTLLETGHVRLQDGRRASL